MSWAYDKDGRVMAGWECWGQYDYANQGEDMAAENVAWLALRVQQGEVKTFARVEHEDGSELIYASASMDTDDVIVDRLDNLWDNGAGGWSITTRSNYADPKAAHTARHIQLHRMFDELMDDYFIHHPGALPSKMALWDLVTWSNAQAKSATEPPDEDEWPGMGPSTSITVGSVKVKDDTKDGE